MKGRVGGHSCHGQGRLPDLPVVVVAPEQRTLRSPAQHVAIAEGQLGEVPGDGILQESRIGTSRIEAEVFGGTRTGWRSTTMTCWLTVIIGDTGRGQRKNRYVEEERISDGR